MEALIRAAISNGYHVFDAAGDGNCAIYASTAGKAILGKSEQPTDRVSVAEGTNLKGPALAKAIRAHIAHNLEKIMGEFPGVMLEVDAKNARDNLLSGLTIEMEAYQAVEAWAKVESASTPESLQKGAPVRILFDQHHCMLAVKPQLLKCKIVEWTSRLPLWRVSLSSGMMVGGKQVVNYAEQVRLNNRYTDFSEDGTWAASIKDACRCDGCTQTSPLTPSTTPHAEAAVWGQTGMMTAISHLSEGSRDQTTPQRDQPGELGLMSGRQRGGTVTPVELNLDTRSPRIRNSTPTTAREGDGQRRSDRIKEKGNKSKKEDKDVLGEREGEREIGTAGHTETERQDASQTPSHMKEQEDSPIDVCERLRKCNLGKNWNKCFCGASFKDEGCPAVALFRHVKRRHRIKGQELRIIDMLPIMRCTKCKAIQACGEKRKWKERPTSFRCFECHYQDVFSGPTFTRSKQLRRTIGLLTSIKEHVEKAKEGGLKSATEEAAEELTNLLYSASSGGVARKYKAPTNRTEEYLRKGDNTKAVRSRENAGLAEPKLQAIEGKFPLRNNTENEFRLIEGNIKEKITVKQVTEEAERVKSTTSSGPNGVPHGVLVDIVLGEEGGAELVTDTLNLILESIHVCAVKTILDLTEVKLVCLNKGTEGDFRPICIGNSLNRMLQAIIVRRSKGGLNGALHPQDQSTRPSGQSNVVTALAEMARRGFTIIKSDRKNAFNSLPMKTAQRCFSRAGLGELAWVASILQSHRVISGDDVVFYAQSVPQGSSIGPAAMAATTNEVLQPIREESARQLTMSFVDDMFLVATGTETAMELLDRVNKALGEVGLLEEARKRIIYNADSVEAVKALGVYIGTDGQVRKALQQAFLEVEELIKDFTNEVGKMKFEQAPKRQTALRALRVNLVPKLIYLIQHHPLSVVSDMARIVDKVVLEAFATILGLTREEAQQREAQIRLPTSMGGFGIGSLYETAPLQRIGTLIRALSFTRDMLERVGESDGLIIQELEDLIQMFLKNLASTSNHKELKADLRKLSKWNARAAESNKAEVSAFATIQQRLTDRHYELKQAAWIATIPSGDLGLKERVNSIIAPEAGRPLTVIVMVPTNQLTDPRFIMWSRHRLLLPVTDGTKTCVVRNKILDPHLDHGFKCGGKGLSLGKTHDCVKWGMYRVIQGLVANTCEKVEMEPIITRWLKPEVANKWKKNAAEGKGEKAPRGDILISSILGREQTLIDVRHCAMVVPMKDGDLGTTVRRGEQDKDKAYSRRFELPEGVVFVPFVVDAYGKWGARGKALIEYLCRKASGGVESVYNSRLGRAWDGISVAHAKGVGDVLSECTLRCFSDEDFVDICTRSNTINAVFSNESIIRAPLVCG
jgi:Reverse transcriptase (RNA-dependent DNA polymerase)